MNKRIAVTIITSALAGALLLFLGLVGYAFYLDKTGQLEPAAATKESAQPVASTPDSFGEVPPWEIEKAPWEEGETVESTVRPSAERPWYEKLNKPDIGQIFWFIVGLIISVIAWAFILNFIGKLCGFLGWDKGAEFFDTPWEAFVSLVDRNPLTFPDRSGWVWLGIMGLASVLTLWLGNPVIQIIKVIVLAILPWVLLFGVGKIVAMARPLSWLALLGVPWDVAAFLLKPLFTAASEVAQEHWKEQKKKFTPGHAPASKSSVERTEEAKAEIEEAKAQTYTTAAKAIADALESDQEPPQWALKIVAPGARSNQLRPGNRQRRP